jgi:hypothetical protein
VSTAGVPWKTITEPDEDQQKILRLLKRNLSTACANTP